MSFNTLAFMVGYACNAECRCCLWGDLPGKGPVLDVDDACGWIDQACEVADVKIVGFSGGESFLYLKQIVPIADYAQRKHKLTSAISTNSSWATDAAKAHELLKPLYDAGLRQLLLSVDDFHQEYVPLERVGIAYREATALGIQCTLQSIVTKSSKKLAWYLEQLGLSNVDKKQTSEVSCTRMGYAIDRIPEEEFSPDPKALTGYCSMLQPLIIRPEGTVHLCCGPAFAIPALSVGNIREEKLATILERAEWDPVYNALLIGRGPSILVEALRADGKGDLVADSYSSSCEACWRILSTPGIMDLLRRLLDPVQPELFLKRSILNQETVESLSAMFHL